MDNDFNEKIYHGQMEAHPLDATRIAFILRHIPDSNLRVLDIGCFDGGYAIRFKKNSNAVYGIESSVSAAKNARAKGVIVEHGDFMRQEFFDNVLFDVVVAGEVIEHVFDTDVFLQKVWHKLKPGGTIIMTTPNVASLPRRILMLLGRNPYLEYHARTGNAGHIRYFTFADIERLLDDNGFAVISSASDVVNFTGRGALHSTLLPRLFKTIGKTIMICARKDHPPKHLSV